MKKAELIAKIAEKAGTTKADAEYMFNAMFETIAECLKEGEEVAIPSFGAFKVKEVAAKKGRNPQTGEEIDIPASKSVGFKVSSKLKEELN